MDLFFSTVKIVVPFPITPTIKINPNTIGTANASGEFTNVDETYFSSPVLVSFVVSFPMKKDEFP
jgi:hypothetical protein